MPATVRIRFKILHMGLLLVIVPCIIAGFFSWKLYELSCDAERLLVAERKQSDILMAVDQLMVLCASTTGHIGSYLATGRPDYMQRARAYTTRIHQLFIDIDDLTKDEPELKKRFSVFRESAIRQLNILENLGPPKEGESLADLLKRMQSGTLRELLKSAGDNNAKIMEFSSYGRTQLDEMREQEQRKRTQITQLIWVGMLTNIVLWGLVAAWFLKNVTNRLNILVDNAHRLPKGLPLNHKLGGFDELNYLDQALHQAAIDLTKAAEQRQYLMQMVAHDLRSPLMAAQVAVEILNSDRAGQLTEAADRQVSALSRNMARLIALTNDLLTIDRLEAEQLDLDLQSVRPAAIVDDAMETLYALAKQAGIQLNNQCKDEIVRADKDRIAQVITNLLSNAIKFSPKDSVVSIFTETKGSEVMISVKDSGAGIKPDDQTRIFSKFYQLDSGGGRGFGLGLAICKLIVEAHHGTIGVESEPGAGSRFWFTLAQATQLPASVSASSKASV